MSLVRRRSARFGSRLRANLAAASTSGRWAREEAAVAPTLALYTVCGSLRNGGAGYDAMSRLPTFC